MNKKVLLHYRIRFKDFVSSWSTKIKENLKALWMIFLFRVEIVITGYGSEFV